jgi:hypothetical protein
MSTQEFIFPFYLPHLYFISPFGCSPSVDPYLQHSAMGTHQKMVCMMSFMFLIYGLVCMMSFMFLIYGPNCCLYPRLLRTLISKYLRSKGIISLNMGEDSLHLMICKMVAVSYSELRSFLILKTSLPLPKKLRSFHTMLLHPHLNVVSPTSKKYGMKRKGHPYVCKN